MSSHVVVINTDLRRTTVKVTPGTYLTEVLQQACTKLNLSSDKYLLRHNKKQVDLSIPFRTSGLVSGAKLELVQKSNTPSAIQVALQIPQPDAKAIPGGRLIRKFPSDLTLWKVLRQFESGDASNGRNINITARGVAQTTNGAGSGGGQLYYETPVLNIMGRELGSFPDFQKTLSQLGYNSGNVLIRLSYRKTNETLYAAMEQISKYFNETVEASTLVEEASEPQVPATQKEVQAGDVQMTGTPDGPSDRSEKAGTTQEATTQPNAIPGASLEDGAGLLTTSNDRLRPKNVFLAPTDPTPAAASAPINDRDFTPTLAHAQTHQAHLQENSRNKRLLSDKEIEEKEAAEQAKLAAVKSVLIKVRFPDNTSSDWEAGPSESGSFLYEAVRHVMASPEQSFKLVMPGGKPVIKDDASPRHNLIKAYKMAGRVLVNLVWADEVKPEIRKQPFLKSNIAQQGQKVKIPELPQAAPEEPAAPAPKVEQKEKPEEDGTKKKVPKWLKLGKK